MTLEPCGWADAAPILTDDSVVRSIGVRATGIKPSFSSFTVAGKAVLLLAYTDKGTEIHIAAPYRARAGLRGHLKQSLQELKDLGFENIYTMTNGNKSMENMLIRLGFRESRGIWKWL